MTQEELERRLAEIAPGNNPGRLVFTRSTGKRKVTRPNQYGIPEEVEESIPVLTWTDPGTGQTLRVVANPGGNYEIDFDGIDPKNVGEPATKPGAQDQNTKYVTSPTDGKVYSVVSEPGPNGVPTTRVYDPDGNPVPGNVVPGAAKTGESAQPQAGKPYKNAQGQWVQAITDPQGNITGTRPVPPEALPADAEKEGEKAGEPYKNDQGQWVQPITDPSGRVIRVEPMAPGTAPAEKPPSRVDTPYVDKKTGRQLIQRRDVDPSKGIDRTYFVDPATGQEVTLDESSNIKGVPPYTPDLTKPGAGLIDRAKELDELVAAGTITWDQRNQVLEQDRTLASSIASEFNMGVAILREDYQNQTQQRGQDINNAQHRASLANTHVQNALGLVSKFARYLGETPGDAGKLFTSMMAGQLALATSYGGMKDYPREQLPQTLRNFAERATGAATMPGAAPGTMLGATPPNAIGVGAVGNVPAPGGPSALPSPGPETLPAPIFRPQPPAMLPPTNTTDAGGVPREFTPSSATNDPSMLAGGPVGQVPPGISALFGQSMPPVRQPEEDSWRQQAMNRRDLMLGQRMAGGGLPALLEPQGLDLGASMGPMLAPVLNTSVPGLTPDLDFAARRELEAEWFS